MNLQPGCLRASLFISALMLALLCLPPTPAQAAVSRGATDRVPDAPSVSQLASPAASQNAAPSQSPTALQNPASPSPENQQPGTPAAAAAPSASAHTGTAGSEGPTLTRSQAEQMAIRQNPNIHVGQLLALAQHQVVRETRSAELPQFGASVTAQQAEEASRVASGSLSASRLFTRAGASVNFSQLLTDFGRTGNLVASSRLREMAQRSDARATVEDIVLATDQAFYATLEAQAVLQVARQTVAARQTVENQISQLTKNNLRSTLDQSFAQVELSQAQLLLLDAQNNADAALAALDEVLGLDKSVPFRLVDDTTASPPPPPDEGTLEAAGAEGPSRPPGA